MLHIDISVGNQQKSVGNIIILSGVKMHEKKTKTID